MYATKYRAIVIGALTFLMPLVAGAIGLPGIENSISIIPTPAYPTPGQSVRLKATSPALELANYELVWRANGKVIAQGAGLDQATITVPAAGAVSIDLDAIDPDGHTISGHAQIAPAELDLLVDSDAYVPPFYRGRPPGAPGTRVLLSAVTPGVSSAGLTYVWKRNDEPASAISGRGAANVSMNAPFLFGTDRISVDASSGDGSFAGSASVSIPSVEPSIVLYENHPLYGILFNAALGPTNLIRENEMTFSAIPYFAQALSPNDVRLQWAWRINDKAIDASADDPSEITLSSKSSGQALVSISLTHATNFFIDSKGSWSITLSSGYPANDIFNASR